MKTKELIHAPKKCGGTLVPEFTAENLPYLKCDKCAHVVDDWIRWENTYSKFYLDDDKWADKKHSMVCLLGQFCSLYFDHYQMKYSLSLSDKGLFNGPETALLRRIMKMLDNDIALTREYIQWVFASKVKQRKKKITSLSFMCVPDFVQEFKFAKKKAQTITRDTLLPTKMLDWVNHFIPSIHNYVSLKDFNDLNVLLTHYRSGHLINVSEVSTFITKLQEAGYVDDACCLKNWRANA